MLIKSLAQSRWKDKKKNMKFYKKSMISKTRNTRSELQVLRASLPAPQGFENPDSSNHYSVISAKPLFSPS